MSSIDNISMSYKRKAKIIKIYKGMIIMQDELEKVSKFSELHYIDEMNIEHKHKSKNLKKGKGKEVKNPSLHIDQEDSTEDQVKTQVFKKPKHEKLTSYNEIFLEQIFCLICF